MVRNENKLQYQNHRARDLTTKNSFRKEKNTTTAATTRNHNSKVQQQQRITTMTIDVLESKVLKLRQSIRRNESYMSRAFDLIWKLDNLTTKDTYEEQDKLYDFIARCEIENTRKLNRIDRLITAYNNKG